MSRNKHLVKPYKTKSGFTREEERLLQDFSPEVSAGTSVLLYGYALFVCTVPPIWITLRKNKTHLIEIHGLSLLLCAIFAGISAWLLEKAYRNIRFLFKCKMVMRKQQEKSETNKKKTRKMARNENTAALPSVLKVLSKYCDSLDFHATALSILSNNLLYFLLFLITSSYLLSGLPSTVNYALSSCSSAGVLVLLSTTVFK